MALRKNPTAKFDALRDAAARARLPYDKDVWLNVAFFLDEQYVEWASDARAIRAIPRPEGFENTPRPITNKIMYFAAQQHAQALQDKPTADVLPSGDGPIEASEAAVSKAYVDWLSSVQVADLEGELSDAVLWAVIGGEGYLKWTYDANGKRGDIMSCAPLDIYADPYARRFSKSRYVFHCQFMDVEQIYDVYGTEVPPDQTKRVDQIKTELLRDMGQAPVLEGAMVNELWMKPCRRYPRGLFVVWSGQRFLVEPRPFPYQHKHLPFTQLGLIPRPGTPHYTCPVKYLRSPQMETNKYHAQRIMIREAFANPKWWIPAELELEADPDDSPRQILRGQGGARDLKPEIIQPTTMPGNDDGAWIGEEMMHVVGQHEVSQAQVPGRVEAAKAIQMLKDSDASRLSELRRTIKLSLAEGFWQQLQLAKQYVSEEMILQTYSPDGVPEVRRFKGEMVKPGFKVQITLGTGLSGSRASREDMLTRWWELGIIQDPALMAELMEVPAGRISPTKSADIRLARNENLRMAEEDAITPNSWDDHPIHLREHNTYRKTSEYQMLSTKAKQVFEFHCEHHEIGLVEELQKQAEMAAIAQGAGVQQPGDAPPSGGSPSGPAPAPAQAA